MNWIEIRLVHNFHRHSDILNPHQCVDLFNKRLLQMFEKYLRDTFNQTKVRTVITLIIKIIFQVMN